MTMSAPPAANALSRSTLGTSWLFNWLNGKFNIFTPLSGDVVNTSNISIQSSQEPVGYTVPISMIGGKRNNDKSKKSRKYKSKKGVKKGKKTKKNFRHSLLYTKN